MVPSTHWSLLRDMVDPNTQGPAWATFQQRYGPAIRHWCKQRKLQDADIEDVTQKVMLNLFRSLGSYDRSRGPFRGWLRGVVSNAITDLFRQQQKPGGRGSGDSSVHELLANLEASAADELATVLEQRLDGDVQRALAVVQARAEERTWQAFCRVALEGQPPDVVATQFGMSRGAVYQAVYRLQKRLAEEYARLQAEAATPVKEQS